MDFQPLGSFVVVKVHKEGSEMEKSDGGLFIVQHQSLKKEGVATVLAVGEGKELSDGSLRPLRVKIGDIILYDLFSGVPMKIEGKEVLVLRDAEIYGVFKVGGK